MLKINKRACSFIGYLRVVYFDPKNYALIKAKMEIGIYFSHFYVKHLFSAETTDYRKSNYLISNLFCSLRYEKTP